MAFRVGQRVTLKDDEPWDIEAEVGPSFGSVYTVRGVVEYDDGPGLLLAEIVNKPDAYDDGFAECTFDASEFRPVVDKSTDAGMAVLKSLLQPKSARKRVRA